MTAGNRGNKDALPALPTRMGPGGYGQGTGPEGLPGQLKGWINAVAFHKEELLGSASAEKKPWPDPEIPEAT